jgi:DnaJ-class molecular chaperone
MKKVFITLGVTTAIAVGGLLVYNNQSGCVAKHNHEHHHDGSVTKVWTPVDENLLAVIVTCSSCNGSKIDPMDFPCSKCNRGKVDKVESITCDLCDGKKWVPKGANDQQVKCPQCQGVGYKNKTVQVTCGVCNGKDSEKRPCRKCKGSGQVDV